MTILEFKDTKQPTEEEVLQRELVDEANHEWQKANRALNNFYRHNSDIFLLGACSEAKELVLSCRKAYERLLEVDAEFKAIPEYERRLSEKLVEESRLVSFVAPVLTIV